MARQIKNITIVKNVIKDSQGNDKIEVRVGYCICDGDLKKQMNVTLELSNQEKTNANAEFASIRTKIELDEGIV